MKVCLYYKQNWFSLKNKVQIEAEMFQIMKSFKSTIEEAGTKENEAVISLNHILHKSFKANFNKQRIDSQ